MDKFIELCINDNDLKNMITKVPNIVQITEEEINNKIDILTYVGCNQRHIKNILISNPNYLDRMDEDILKLIKYLKEIGFSSLYLLFDTNPYFLNYDVFEIRDYINSQINLSKSLKDIINEIEDNPYIIEE